MALQSGKAHCPKNRGATFHMNNIHYNKYITVKTHTRIISDGLSTNNQGKPTAKKIGGPLFSLQV